MATERLVHVNADTPHLAVAGMPTSSSKYVESFKENFKVQVQSLNKEEIVMDLVGIDSSLSNAMRRILIAEVPTMAIETVYIWNNSSIIQDEVLAHRVGLIPLNVDPRAFQSFPEVSGLDDEAAAAAAEATDENTIVFKLDVVCKTNPEFPDDLSKAFNANVYARDLEWVPQGNQEAKFGTIRPVHEDILLAKLRPGQAIAFEAHCRKGVGKDHAKFSPVSTASYRLQPKITFPEDITGNDAETLKAMCPMNVFDIEDMMGEGVAVAARPRDCTMCRECIRDPEWENRIQLSRSFEHFIFSIESVGMLKPEELVSEALDILIEKCDNVLESLSSLEMIADD